MGLELDGANTETGAAKGIMVVRSDSSLIGDATARGTRGEVGEVGEAGLVEVGVGVGVGVIVGAGLEEVRDMEEVGWKAEPLLLD